MYRLVQNISPIAVFLLIVLVVSLGCGGTATTPTILPAAKIELTGTVKYNSALTIGTSTTEYMVEVALKNGGGQMFTFNKAEGAFVTAEGKGLRSTSTNLEKGRFDIAAGTEISLEFATDGYTYDLIADANGGKLFFVLTLYQDDTVVYGPRIAPLPDIFELMKETEPRTLVFE